MSLKEKELYEFGEFSLDVADHSLVRSDTKKRVPLSDKAFETLCILLRNAGHLVEKSELMDQVWADAFVEENNLNKCIHSVRRALGENGGKQRFIETVQKRGYRFIADVRRVGSASDEPAESIGQDLALDSVLPVQGGENKRVSKSLAAFSLAAFLVGAIGVGWYVYYSRKTAASDKRSIAVLPLKPIETTNRNELFENGIADSLILKLSLMKGFVVRPLSATRKYADLTQDALAAGREQKVDYVLASNYQLADGKIKITTGLINVASGQVEESLKIEKDARDIFAMQDAIASEIGTRLQARFATTSIGLTAKRGTTNEEAYWLYLQGRNMTYNRTAAAAGKSVEYFEGAIRLDPNYALAYVGMAHALVTSGNLGGDLPRIEYEKAKAAVTKALELDNNLAEGYAVSGELKFTSEWDFAGAEKDLLRAIELEPNSDLAHQRYAFYLAIQGRFEEASAEAKTAQELNPDSLQNQHVGGIILYFARRYDEAILQHRRVIEVDENHSTAYAWLSLAYDLKGDTAGAYEWFIKAQKLRNPESLDSFQNAYEIAGWRGVKRKFFERQKLNEQKPSSNLYAMARQCALLGDTEQAFEYLNKTIEKHQGQLVMLGVEPGFDILHEDPRFDALVRRVGLK